MYKGCIYLVTAPASMMSRTLLVLCLLGLVALACARPGGPGGRRGGRRGEEGRPERRGDRDSGRRPPPGGDDSENPEGGAPQAPEGGAPEAQGAAAAGQDEDRSDSHEGRRGRGGRRGGPRDLLCRVDFDGVDPPQNSHEPEFAECASDCALRVEKPGPDGEGKVIEWYCNDKDENDKYLLVSAFLIY